MPNRISVLIRNSQFFLILLLTSCAFIEPAPQAENLAPQSLAPQIVEDYKIGVGDTLRVDVWKNPDLSITVPVRPDGKISAPLVGDIAVSEKTALSVRDELTMLLENYVLDPVVTIIVLEIGNNSVRSRVRITGAVLRPLSSTLIPGMTVLDLVLEAGGANEFAQLNRAMLYRSNGERLRLDLKAILHRGDLTTNYPLAPGDIVTVPEKGI